MRLLVFLSFLASSLPAFAAVFLVDTTADDVDAIPGDGICAAVSGGCTLRAAIIESNQVPGLDEIIVPSGTYALTIGGPPEDGALAGDLDVLDDVEVHGAGASSTVIDAAGAEAGISLLAGASDISDLTLTGGLEGGLTVGTEIDDSGINDCTIENNLTTGIRWVPETSASWVSDLTVLRTSIHDNGGDGIRVFGGSPGLLVEDSAIASNEESGIELKFNFSGSEPSIRGTVIEDNVGSGIAMDLAGRVTIEDSIVRRNHSGVWAWESVLHIARSSIEDNGIGLSPGLGSYSQVSASSVVRNGGGGIVIISDSTVEVSGSTISGNSTAGGISIQAWSGPSVLRVRDSTITQNSGSVSGGIARLESNSPAVVEVSRSVLAGNMNSAGASDCGDAVAGGVPISFAGSNVLGSVGDCAFTSLPSDQIGISSDGLLGPLAANGGPTPTHALLPGSPGIDTSAEACTSTDQRGFERPIDGDSDGAAICDSGAFEYGAGDFDGDALPDPIDNCPRVANAGQSDGDGDEVGDACDNCSLLANPRPGWKHLILHPWIQLTGGQRDDDLDGYGNKCDAKFPGTGGGVVGGLDLAQFRASNSKSVSSSTCGTSGTLRCAIFDLDEAGNTIGGLDLGRFRILNTSLPGPKCDACPLP